MLWQCLKSADSITATSVAPRSHVVQLFASELSKRSALARVPGLDCRHAALCCDSLSAAVLEGHRRQRRSSNCLVNCLQIEFWPRTTPPSSFAQLPPLLSRLAHASRAREGCSRAALSSHPSRGASLPCPRSADSTTATSAAQRSRSRRTLAFDDESGAQLRSRHGLPPALSTRARAQLRGTPSHDGRRRARSQP